MNSLCVLSQIVQARESPRTVTLKRAFSGMLSDMPRQMLTACEAQLAWRKVGTKESLSLLLFRWSLRFTCYALVIRSVPVIVIVSHFHVLIITRLSRMRGVM